MLASNNANCIPKLIQIEIKIQCINLQKQYNFLKTHISKLLKINKKFHFSPSAPKYIIHSLFHIKHLPIKKKKHIQQTRKIIKHPSITKLQSNTNSFLELKLSEMKTPLLKNV